jgi:copper chaperone NosL
MQPLKALRIGWFVLGLSALASCQKGPRPIVAGESCTFCRMGISEPGFAAELVTDKGKVFPFDSIECLAAYTVGPPEVKGTPWVTNFNKPGEWLKADEAFFIRSPNLRSPMGLNLAAFKTRADFEKAMAKFQGADLRWDDVLLLVRTSGFSGHKGEHPNGAAPP